jgi:DNA/RNA-binding domain of Phe-tRNA-synthetase-like protein
MMQINGSIRSLKPQDMMMSDGKGIICTIIYGQDARTPISPNTRRALYVAYAPAGVSGAMVQQQLDSIHENILLAAPETELEMLMVFSATSAKISM